MPLAVDQATTWSELVPDRFQVMAARGVVPETAADMARAYPDLFPTADAATMAIQRSPTSLYRNIFIRECWTPRHVTYQPAGQGQKPRSAAIYGDIDARQWLESRLGIQIKLITVTAPADDVPVAQPIDHPPDALDAALERLCEVGGRLPPEASQAVRDACRAANVTQQQAAILLDMSRPTLANALKGRFGLSPAKVIAVRDFLARPPPERQLRLDL